jgi:hypothetical protein
MKTKGFSFPFISFHLFFGIGAFQRVTADSNRIFLAARPRAELCAIVMARLPSAAPLAMSMAHSSESHSTRDFRFPEDFVQKSFRGRASRRLFLVLSPIETPVLGFLFPFGIAKLGVDGHVLSPSFLLNLGFELARLFLQFLQGFGKFLAGRLVRVWSRHVSLLSVKGALHHKART